MSDTTNTYIYDYRRYNVAESHRSTSLEQLLDFAMSDIEFNTAYPLKIVDGRGNVIYDHDAILAKWREHYMGDADNE